MSDRVVFTPAAAALVRTLKAAQGPLIFHLSGGCCEGSAPMCLRQSDFRPGGQDVLLGEIEGYPFYVGAAQSKYWARYQIVVDVTEGGGDSFSIEAAEGVRFTVASCPLTDQEMTELAKAETKMRRAAAATADASTNEIQPTAARSP